ncbi:MAG TPA: response regulator transcription factor [Solirubrobacterales bacterium]|nr:response regulator transcription factor [Solirubrobacterales bacterium]
MSPGGAETGRKVLVCDDEMQILRGLKLILREAGFEPLPAATATEALDIASLKVPDAAIVDLVLPDGDGVDVCRSIRSWSEMPLIVLSAVGDEDRKVAALEAGADDYVTKPFSPRELIARLEAVLRRRPGGSADPRIEVNGLSIDLSAHTVSRDGGEIHLTPIEYDLLRQLILNRGRLMTHRTLLTEVWGPGYADDTQVLRTHIANLRRKIETPHRRFIRTDTGVGYRFSA